MFLWYIALLTFCLAAILDGIWASYTVAISNLKPFKSAVTGAIIYALNSFVVISYTTNAWYIIFAVLGAFIGTYIMVTHEKKKKEKSIS